MRRAYLATFGVSVLLGSVVAKWDSYPTCARGILDQYAPAACWFGTSNSTEIYDSNACLCPDAVFIASSARAIFKYCGCDVLDQTAGNLTYNCNQTSTPAAYEYAGIIAVGSDQTQGCVDTSSASSSDPASAAPSSAPSVSTTASAATSTTASAATSTTASAATSTTASAATSTPTVNPEPRGKSLDSGAIAGIIVACIFGVPGFILVGFEVEKRWIRREPERAPLNRFYVRIQNAYMQINNAAAPVPAGAGHHDGMRQLGH